MKENKWDEMRKEINDLHVRISKKPQSQKRGLQVSPGGILNAYREGDLAFDDAVKLLEGITKYAKKEVLAKLIKSSRTWRNMSNDLLSYEITQGEIDALAERDDVEYKKTHIHKAAHVPRKDGGNR